MADRIDDNQTVQVMVVGIGATVKISESGGTPLLVWTTVDEIETGTITGPCDILVEGADLYRIGRSL